MANIGGIFNANAVAPATGNTLLPPGVYTAMMTESEVAQNTNSEGSHLKCTFEVCDGPNKGAKIFHRLNLWNKSPIASEIAQKEFSAMCHATMDEAERNAVSDSSQLHNRPMALTVEVSSYTKKDGSAGNGNEIKKFERLGAPAASAAPMASSLNAGQQMQAAVTTAAPAQQAAFNPAVGAGQPATPAWAQKR